VIVVGLMSGTSVDAIDAAVVDVTYRDAALHVALLAYVESPIDETLRERIHALFSPETSRID
jgi:anhydro-N-acetylmuramic acid kinase